MNKMMLVSILVIFVVWMGLDFLIHGVLLESDYKNLSTLYRSDQEAGGYFPIMLLAHVLMSIGFVWIYLKGKEAKPNIGQGIRFGIAIALLMTIPTYLIYYVVMPLPWELVCKQIVFGSISVIILGVVVSVLNK